jgi:putative acetyltransferase
VVIRLYQPSDREALLAVWAESAPLAHPFWESARFEHERREIAETFLPVAETYVFERAGELVGFIALLGNEVGGLFVTPRCHRLGIGRALMDRVRRTRGVLELDVYEGNEIGRGFYEAYGFGIVGERREEGTGLVILRLRLPSDTR